MAPSAIETITTCNDDTIQGESIVNLVGPRDTAEDGKRMIRGVMNERIAGIDHQICQPGDEDAFFVADIGEVYRQHMRWKMNLKRVKPHYAVKCNPDEQVLRLLAALGAGFDCASKAEIDQVLGLGVHPSRIIYAQPCKTISYIRYAGGKDVKQMTFDNADELYKIQRFYPEAELFLRILTDDSASLCRLSDKFGASLGCTQGLLQTAKSLGLNVVGVSFHVGSGASDPQSFARAVRDSRIVFDQAERAGYDLRILDVGGGFSSALFEDMATVLSNALDEHFPPHIRIIGEPGRYYVSSAFSLACNIIARRDVLDPSTGDLSYMLYLNDGVYGNFSSIIFDHQHPLPQVLRRYANNPSGAAGKTTRTLYSVWGPSCDGIDKITDHVAMEAGLDIGDWLTFDDMGAYTKCSATRFNGFTDQHEVFYVCSEPGAKALLGW